MKSRKRSTTKKLRSRLRLYQRFNGICYWCQKRVSFREASRDHIEPKGSGGTDAIGNLLLSCRACNNARGSQSAESFAKIMARPVPVKTDEKQNETTPVPWHLMSMD